MSDDMCWNSHPERLVIMFFYLRFSELHLKISQSFHTFILIFRHRTLIKTFKKVFEGLKKKVAESQLLLIWCYSCFDLVFNIIRDKKSYRGQSKLINNWFACCYWRKYSYHEMHVNCECFVLIFITWTFLF